MGFKIKDFGRLKHSIIRLKKQTLFMLYLVQSNKMECLAESLISCLQETAGQGVSVFEPDQILVQSPGMSQWLKIQIAEN